MAKNDVILLDAVLSQRRQDLEPSDELGEVFELFALQEVLKHFDLSRDEIDSGWIDGRDDGGIDGFYTFVNGHLVQDHTTFVWPKRSADIEVYILTSKHHETFQQAPLNSLLASIPELLDLSLQDQQLRGQYSEDVLGARQILHAVIRQLVVTRPTLRFRFAYMSRGDATSVADNIKARANQLAETVHTLFSDCSVVFDFIGATELIGLYRTVKKFSLELPIIEHLTGGSTSYIALSRLDDYARFVTDTDGTLRRYLFDSNVRDYLGPTAVNEDIFSSLSDTDAPDFWWLNNGVTILATSAAVVGKVIQLQDVQIVNGLQTTETLFRAFYSATLVRPERAVMVKVVVASDTSIRDRIIRATNNQSLVEAAALRATDKIQRDIEETLVHRDWYYERRTNYYRNTGKPSSRFVTPLYLAAGCVSLVMKNPAAATKLQMRFMRSEATYRSVFDPNLPLPVWLAITEVVKRVEAALNAIRPANRRGGDRFAYRWRNLVALLVVAKKLGSFSYAPSQLAAFDATSISDGEVTEIWAVISGVRGNSARHDYRRPAFVRTCCAEVAKMYEVANPEAVGHKSPLPEQVNESRSGGRDKASRVLEIDEEFIDAVDSALPAQPWKPGVHVQVCAATGRSRQEVQLAIQALIERGRRNRQKDGIVYDAGGNIIAVDESRVRQSK